MNCKEHHLPELELSTGLVREALQCLLHTILFLRSPGSVTPRDVHCEGFPNLVYTSIATSTSKSSKSTTTSASDNKQQQQQQQQPSSSTTPPSSYSLEINVDQKVDDAVDQFLRTSLSQIGPELLQGSLTLQFFERRATRQLFGLVSHEEKVVWEQWIIRVIVNNTPRPINNDSASVIERQRIQDTAEAMLRSALSKVFEIVGGPIDHVPPVMYEFEMSCAKRPDDREAVHSRVANMPPILNLSN